MNINEIMLELRKTGVFRCSRPCKDCLIRTHGGGCFRCQISSIFGTLDELDKSVCSDDYGYVLIHMIALVNSKEQSRVCDGISCDNCELARVYDEIFGTHTDCSRRCLRLFPNLKKHLLSNKTNT